MARRIPWCAHRDAPVLGEYRENTNRVYFCRVAAAVAGQKACGFYPASAAISLAPSSIPRFFPLRSSLPCLAARLPLFSLRALFFCCHVASAARSASRLSRASVTTVLVVSLSFSLSFRPRCTLLN